MKRVVITGMGALTPIGNKIGDFWQNAIEGKSGAGPITRFDASQFKTQFACELKGFDASSFLSRAEIKRADTYSQYALYAAGQALEDSGIHVDKLASPFDMGVIWASGQGGMGTLEGEVQEFAKQGDIPRFNPFLIPKFLINMASGLISMKHGLMGINYTTVSACAASNTAFMDAFNYIRLGKAKAFVAGGSDSPLTAASVGGFNAMKALSTRNDAPQKASRPFDQDRDGFVMGEGAGALVLEEYEHAKKRGAHIYAELAGAAMTADAYHISATHPEGIGAAHGMQQAMAEAGLSADQLGYINAHATSTPVGDISELNAIKKAFGKDAEKIAISGTKSMTGHLLGAAGAIEAILCIKAINEKVIPPTINVENVDPQLPENMNLVLNQAMESKVKAAMSNSFGFGGHNSIVVFKEV